MSAYTDYVTALSPWLWWRYAALTSNGSNDVVADSSGNGRSGAILSGGQHSLVAGLVPNESDTALNNNIAVTVANAQPPNGPFSALMWMRLSSWPGYDIVPMNVDVNGVPADFRWRMYLTQSGKNLGLVWNPQAGGGFGSVTSTAPALALNTTYLIGITHDQTTMKLFVNGAKTHESAVPAFSTSTQPFKAGGLRGGTSDDTVPGVIDDVLYFDKVLTEAQMSGIYSSTTAVADIPFYVGSTKASKMYLGNTLIDGSKLGETTIY